MEDKGLFTTFAKSFVVAILKTLPLHLQAAQGGILETRISNIFLSAIESTFVLARPLSKTGFFSRSSC